MTIPEDGEALPATHEIAVGIRPRGHVESSQSELSDADIENYLAKIACTNCDALCSRAGVVLKLNPTEADFMQSSGTVLEHYVSNRRERIANMLRGSHARKNYLLKSDCGWLDQGTKQCTVYTNPRRPLACQSFPVGQYRCLEVRSTRRLDPPEVFRFWRRQTQS